MIAYSVTFPLLWFAFSCFLSKFYWQFQKEVLALLLVPVFQFSSFALFCIFLYLLNLHSHLILIKKKISLSCLQKHTKKNLDSLFLESHYCLPSAFYLSLHACGLPLLSRLETCCSTDFTCYVKSEVEVLTHSWFNSICPTLSPISYLTVHSPHSSPFLADAPSVFPVAAFPHLFTSSHAFLYR